MKILKEDVVFASNDVNLIKQVYGRSNKSVIDYSSLSSEDEARIKKILDNMIERSVGGAACSKYCLLKAACYGPDTSRNSLLNYVMQLPEDCWNEDNVLSCLDLAIKDEIELNNLSEDSYLFNNSLYSRNANDFIYSVKAFDAVINKKDKYFDGDFVKVSLDNKTLKKFFGEDVVPENGSAQEDEFDFDLEEDLLKEDVYVSQVPVNQKYFFSKRQVSNNDTIIPAGFNESNENRTIWNYMEIWSNPIDKTDKAISSEQRDKVTNNRNKQKRDTIDSLKKLINNQNSIDDETKEAASQALDSLLK